MMIGPILTPSDERLLDLQIDSDIEEGLHPETIDEDEDAARDGFESL